MGQALKVVNVSYKSHRSLFGLPLIHVASGQVIDGCYKRGIARGWIAIGDISFGILFSLGGVAFGGISIGGASLGVITLGGVGLGVMCLGGLALGGYAAGGFAIGIVAVGGGAIALYDAAGGLAIAGHAAEGGLAIASEYAVGGEARAVHANDPAARQYMATSPVRVGTFIVGPWSQVVAVSIVALTTLLVVFGRNDTAKPPPLDKGLE